MRDLIAWWSSPSWRAEAEAWIRTELGAAAYDIVGTIEQPRVRFWSTQLTVPTDRGRVWFKENAPSQGFEATLVAALHRLVPGRVVAPIAVDPGCGRLLSPDAGPTLRDRGSSGDAEWVRVLSEYAALQRSLEPHVAEVLAAGVTHLPTPTAPAMFDEAVDRLAALPTDSPRRLPVDEAGALLDGRPLLVEAAEALAASGIPDSLQHNDLHDNNAFVPGDGPLEFFDFGDAAWAHPFAVTMIPVRVMSAQFAVGPTDPRIVRVLDAYLEHWTDIAPLAELRALVLLAARLGSLHRYASWRRLLDDVPLATIDAEWRDAEHWGLRGAVLR